MKEIDFIRGTHQRRSHYALALKQRKDNVVRILGGLSIEPHQPDVLNRLLHQASTVGYPDVTVIEVSGGERVEQLDPPVEIMRPHERHIKVFSNIHDCLKP